jgi:hypothetical protein
MTSRGKKIFLALSIVIPFLIYSIVYYAPIIRNAPYKFKEFKGIEYKWGVGTNLENSYNSATGDYRYYNDKDSLVTKKVMLTAKDQFYLDSIAHIQGFFNLPDIMANSEKDVAQSQAPRFLMKFNYQDKSKEVTYLSDFEGNPRMKDAAVQVQKVLSQTITDAEERISKSTH